MKAWNKALRSLGKRISELGEKVQRFASGEQARQSQRENWGHIQTELLRLTSSVEALSARIDDKAAATLSEVAQVRSDAARLADNVQNVREITAHLFDRTAEHRAKLLEVRRSEEYGKALAVKEPLISVRIATYNRPEILFERAVPSVFKQTYSNFELIVIGDGAGEETVSRAGTINDPRFKFVNLPRRGIYPDDPRRRWLVAGSPAMNHGARLAKGTWIAPLDDDDEFCENHIEALLKHAQDESLEMVYGRMHVVPNDGRKGWDVGEYPPKHGTFGFQAAMYLAALNFFQYEPQSWVLNEPGDWNLCRRMIAAGVQIGFTPKVVTTIYPSGPRAP